MEPSTHASPSPKRSRIFVLIALSVLLLTGTWFMTSEKESGTIIVTFPNGSQLETEVADTPEKIFFGLAFREGLPSNSGMLYIFETSDRHRMRTKGFKIPVDMIWADESRHIVHIVGNVEPCQKDPCPYYEPPSENARYVIEAAAGFVTQEHVEPGMELKFTLRM